MNSLIVLISGPSGVGKDSIINKLRENCSSINVTVTATTRSIRPGEIDGKDYIFIDDKKFDHMINKNEFLEHATVYGYQYGVPKDQVTSALSRGQDALIKTDVQGSRTIMKLEPSALSIFIMPESNNDLENRLNKRMTESKQALKVRLDTAVSEINQARNFEFIVYNKEGHIEQTIKEVEKIISKAKRSTNKRVFNIINETTS
ncbi:MAG: guanylate kinase [Chloroflexi bacterium]|nr:MAG: guanylate kinase [Chloroflexota bacterium]